MDCTLKLTYFCGYDYSSWTAVVENTEGRTWTAQGGTRGRAIRKVFRAKRRQERHEGRAHSGYEGHEPEAR